jgi:hypothetical protein
MATKQKFVTPVGEATYSPWVIVPSKWDNKARDGQGGSVKGELNDTDAKFNIALSFSVDAFSKSDFKKSIDNLWDAHKKAHDGKYDVERPPYVEKDGNIIVKARKNAAYKKGSDTIVFKQPYVIDCEGNDKLEYFTNSNTYPGAGCTARIEVTCYIPDPVKNPQTKEMILKMEFDLVGVQFSDAKEQSLASGGNLGSIEGVPIMAGMAETDDIPF